MQTPNVEANQMLFGEDDETKLKEGGQADDGEDDDYDSEDEDESEESD